MLIGTIRMEFIFLTSHSSHQWDETGWDEGNTPPPVDRQFNYFVGKVYQVSLCFDFLTNFLRLYHVFADGQMSWKTCKINSIHFTTLFLMKIQQYFPRIATCESQGKFGIFAK